MKMTDSSSNKSCLGHKQIALKPKTLSLKIHDKPQYLLLRATLLAKILPRVLLLLYITGISVFMPLSKWQFGALIRLMGVEGVRCPGRDGH
ncbi:hypothetical protein NECAME_12127 [Necator americanus]|uniref:Uncharacterized protein n=1 Tax=Necator americanus TaxID=51031 RepID=W2T1C5_NECAM|nr:hypothetical protein NECAME_12127 [Necator americanus]ETN75785.1 hypothetical protein NECAME_12127 [Necator americanus]